MRTKDDLRQLQALPLELKIPLTKRRIVDWVNEFGVNGVYVSFSGGKDSTVLLHIVREIFPEVEAVFVNTGLEYPEIQHFVKTFDNVTILRPKMRFDEVIKNYGYPIISKKVAKGIDAYKRDLRWGINAMNGVHSVTGEPCGFMQNRYGKWKPITEMDFKVSDKCCLVMKEAPLDQFARQTGKKPITALMASESHRREQAWLQTGCNAFDSRNPMSKPMSFWTEQDVFQYIKKYNIPIAPVYGQVVYEEEPAQQRIEEYGIEGCGTEKLCTTGLDRTGCIFCAFGAHLDKESRFERLKQTHPRQYEYCIGGGEYDENGAWKPNKQGLGMGHVFDELNKIYGDDFIKY